MIEERIFRLDALYFGFPAASASVDEACVGGSSMKHRRRAAVASAIYALSLFAPAFVLNGETVPGWSAAQLSFLGSWLSLINSAGLLSFSYESAAMLGAAANVAFYVSVVMSVFGFARRAAKFSALALCAAALSIVALLLSRSGFVPHAGCGLWLVAILWLGWDSAREAAGHDGRSQKSG